MQQRASAVITAVRGWVARRAWAHPTFWIGIGFSTLLLLVGFVSGPFLGLTMLALILFPTALYVAVTRRGSWLQLPRRRMSGVVGMVASVVILAIGVAGTGATSDVAVNAASSVNSYQTPTASASHAATATPKPARTPTPMPTATIAPSPTTVPASQPAGEETGDQTALALLAELPTKPAESMSAYDRVVDFGTSWIDVDHNGCDTRNDVLARDLTQITRSGSCEVLIGILADPYTGRVIDFVRGVRTSAAVQIDHIVPLADAWRTGAQELSAAQRVALANDPLNLLAVDGPTNESKGDDDASAWLPANVAYRCPYAARQVSVKKAYGLWVTGAERAALQAVLSSCSNQPAIAAVPVAATAVAAPAPAAPAPVPAAPAPAPAAPAPGVSYANCTAVRAAGAAPILRGQPGYSSKLDRDGDGVACE